VQSEFAEVEVKWFSMLVTYQRLRGLKAILTRAVKELKFLPELL
jgi:hypothetical protein